MIDLVQSYDSLNRMQRVVESFKLKLWHRIWFFTVSVVVLLLGIFAFVSPFISVWGARFWGLCVLYGITHLMSACEFFLLASARRGRGHFSSRPKWQGYLSWPWMCIAITDVVLAITRKEGLAFYAFKWLTSLI